MIEQVKEDIFRICVPIPFPLRNVNMYALIGKDGWAIIDTAIGTSDARAALSDALQQADLSIDKLRVIVLSHHHPDHVGLSGELHQQSGATVYMHPIDEEATRRLYLGTMKRRFSYVSRFLAQHGLPPTDLWLSHVAPEEMHHLFTVPAHEEITLVEDGEYLDIFGEHYRVIWTPGHSDGHICLLRERDGLFIAADHVLPRITPNIGLYSEKDRPNPLGDYLNSLRKIESLPVSLVLPGHGEPFVDLSGRVLEIIEHHRQRELQLLAYLKDRPQNAYQLAQQLFAHRSMNNEAMRMAVAEVLSHLEHLRYNEQVEQHYTDEGVIFYEAL